MIYCEKCKKTITEKEDANILLFLFVDPRAFCNNCYSSKERGLSRHFLYFPKHPINSKAYLYGLRFSIVYLIIILYLMGIDEVVARTHSIPFIFILIGTIWAWIIHYAIKKSLSELE
jgi:hypothetical protein